MHVWQEMVSRCVVVFFTEYKRWWPGVIMEVFPRRTVNENFKIKFEGEDDPALVRLEQDSYGTDRNWVLIPGASLAEARADRTAAATTAAAPTTTPTTAMAAPAAAGEISSQGTNVSSQVARQNADTVSQ
eukprot:SAG25_NODE_3213_length_1170_cov_10.015760_2_plen_130_part_00